jgi:hypothetical protein
VLVDARHVTLRPLAATDVVAFLAGRFGGRSRLLPSRWQPVVAALEAGDPILGVMANPWQLFLAVTAYADEPTEPREMLSMSVATLEAHLLERFVPAVVDQPDSPAWPDESADDVVRWLTGLAVLVRRPSDDAGVSPTDIHLPDLWKVSGQRGPRLIPALAAAALCVLFALYAAAVASGVDGNAAVVQWVMTAVAVFGGVIVTASAASSEASLTRLDLAQLAGRAGRLRFWRELRRSASVGLVFGVLGFIAGGLAINWLTGAFSGAAVTLLVTVDTQIVLLGGELGPAVGPSTLVKQCVTFSVASWLSYVVLFAVISTSINAYVGAELGTAVLLGLLAALVVGTAAWFGVKQGAVWLRYALGVRSAARRNLLPRHPARFLDWCVSVGLMLMAGNTIQFRHKQLQDWLIRRAERSAAASPTG